MKPKAAAPKPKNNNSRPEFLRDGKLGRSPFRLRRNPRASLAAPACGGRGCAPSPSIPPRTSPQTASSPDHTRPGEHFSVVTPKAAGSATH